MIHRTGTMLFLSVFYGVSCLTMKIVFQILETMELLVSYGFECCKDHVPFLFTVVCNFLLFQTNLANLKLLRVFKVVINQIQLLF